jgi:hypothetical protein
MKGNYMNIDEEALKNEIESLRDAVDMIAYLKEKLKKLPKNQEIDKNFANSLEESGEFFATFFKSGSMYGFEMYKKNPKFGVLPWKVSTTAFEPLTVQKLNRDIKNYNYKEELDEILAFQDFYNKHDKNKALINRICKYPMPHTNHKHKSYDGQDFGTVKYKEVDVIVWDHPFARWNDGECWYEGKGYDKYGNSYEIRWEVTNEEAEEECDACDWDVYTVEYIDDGFWLSHNFSDTYDKR